jgi:hypothetical protein
VVESLWGVLPIGDAIGFFIYWWTWWEEPNFMRRSRFGFIRLSLSLLAFVFALHATNAPAQTLATPLAVSGDAAYTMAIGFFVNSCPAV